MEPTSAQHLPTTKTSKISTIKSLGVSIMYQFHTLASCQYVQRIRKFESKFCEPRNTPKFSFGCEILETMLLGSPKNITENHKISLSFLYFDTCNQLSNPRDLWHNLVVHHLSGGGDHLPFISRYKALAFSLSSNSRAKGQARDTRKQCYSFCIGIHKSPLFFFFIIDWFNDDILRSKGNFTWIFGNFPKILPYYSNASDL